jgi:hypothetical protein
LNSGAGSIAQWDSTHPEHSRHMSSILRPKKRKTDQTILTLTKFVCKSTL